ncbi:MAG: GGDEF domain-containing protein [Pseudomonadota bacterium]
MLNRRNGASLLASNLEHGQATIRLVMTTSIFTLMLLINMYDTAIKLPGLVVMMAFYIFAIVQYLWIRLQPTRVDNTRKFIAILADQSFVSGIAILGGESAALFHFVFLWISVGNGMRFGKKYMYLSNLAGTIGFTNVLMFSPYWHGMWSVGIGVIIGLNLIPPYVAGLIKKLEDAHNELTHIVSHDPLTGLLNRRELGMRITAAMARTGRNQQYMALIYLDLDGFKEVNDEAGHAAGDRLLQNIAEKVGNRLRKGDTFIRLGGDEFIVIAECLTTPSDASVLAETIIAEVSNTQVSSDDHKKMISTDPANTHNSRTYRVSASAGIAIFSETDDESISADTLLGQADSAMYLSKKSDTSKVTFFRRIPG